MGELALAREAFKQTGLTSLPNMDDVDKAIVNLREQIQDVRDPKNVARVIDIRHGQLLTKGSGKIRTDLLQFQSKAGLEFGRQRQVDKAAAEKKAKAEERSMSRERAAPKPTKKKKSLEEAAGLPVGTPTETPAETPAAAEPSKSGKKSLEEAAGLGSAAGKMPAERATKLRQVLAEKGLTEQRLLTAINKKAKKGKYTTIEELPEALDKRIAEWIKKAEKAGAKAAPTLAPAAAPAAPAAAAAAAVPEAPGPMAGPWSEAAPGGRVMGPNVPTRAEGPKLPRGFFPQPPEGGLAAVAAPAAPTTPAPTTPAPAAATGKKPSASEIRDRAKKIFGNKGVGAMGGAMRFLGPLLGAFTAYQLLDMARQGTVGAADERRLQALQALGGVSGGLMSDAQQKQQLRQMQQMVDLAAIQRQQGLDQMRQQYTTDQTLNSLLAGNERALAALAMPSRPSIAEMMARY